MKLGLTPEQVAARRLGIGGSDAGKIMAGEWFDLWQEKTGRKPPDDLSNALPVMLGLATEEFNAFWYEKVTGSAVAARGESRHHRAYPFMRCTLDGLVNGDTVWQAKHVSGREPLEVMAARYTPQVTHEMLVCGLERAVLSLLMGTDRFETVPVPLDEFYALTLIERERQFWSYVERDVPPPDAPAIAAPVPPEKWRKVDMTGSNRWSAFAVDWLANKAAAATFDVAAKGLKAMVEADVGVASGHGIVIVRDKRGLSIKEDR